MVRDNRRLFRDRVVGSSAAEANVLPILFPKDTERSEKSTTLLAYHGGGGILGPNGPVRREVRSAKWEKENYPIPFRAKH